MSGHTPLERFRGIVQIVAALAILITYGWFTLIEGQELPSVMAEIIVWAAVLTLLGDRVYDAWRLYRGGPDCSKSEDADPDPEEADR